MRIAIIGSNGQLGTDLVKAFAGHEVVAWKHSDFDVRDHQRAFEAITVVRPDAVINTAAFHKTDACEDEPEVAFATNALATRNLGRACKTCGATLVHISTDYVFDGRKGAPYVEDDAARPINVYGASKFAGEQFVAAACDRYYIARVASLFGIAGASGKGGNFVETMLAKASRGEPIAVIDDITMSPTYTVDAAQAIRGLVEASAAPGLYHLTNAGACTWYAFAREIFRQAGLTTNLRSTTIAAMPSKTRRPAYSALASHRLGTTGAGPLRSWQDALAAYIEKRSVRSLA